MPDDPPARFAPDEPAPAKAGAARAADWRSDTPGAAGNRTVQAVLALLALLTIAGVVIGFFLFWFGTTPAPRLVTVPIGEYDDPSWPINPWANQDSELLAAVFPDREPSGFTSQQQNKFRTLLAGLAAHDAGKARPLVLHVTALAAVRDRKVYLLPGDARPDEPAGWIEVEELLGAFDKAAADRGKLLVLDLAHPTADPFSGVLRDEVSDRLHELLAGRSATLPFPVLTSCGPGEESRPADAEQCSGFAFYLAEGLRGAADGYLATKTDRDRDGEITLSELMAFLSGRVSRWARMVHDRRQTPMLYGRANLGPVFRVRSSSPAETEKPAPDSYPQWLADGWRLRDEQRNARADHPVPFAWLTAALMRAERVWLRSGDAGRAEDDWGAAKGDWQKPVQDSGGPNQTADVFQQALKAVGEYRLVAGRGPPPKPEWESELRQYLEAKRKAEPGKPDESEKLRGEWLKKALPKKSRENRIEVARQLWDLFRESPPTEDRARAWVTALDDLALDREFAETVLLRSLAVWNPRRGQDISQYPHAQAAELLRAEEELSRTLALGPHGFELIQAQLDKAKGVYLEGQKNLFKGKFPEVEQAKEQLKAAADGFKDAHDALKLWQQADRELDAAVAVLLDTMPSVLTAPDPEFNAWVKAVQAATGLADELARIGRERSINPTALEAAMGVVKLLPVVTDPFAVPSEKKEPVPLRARTKPADLLQYERLAAGTALPAESRRKLWDMIRADRQAFHDAARVQDEADDAANDPTAKPTQAAETGRTDEAELTRRRARVSIELLKLAGYAKTGELDAPLAQLDRDPEALGRLLHKAWAKELPKQAQTAANEKRRYEADRIARTTPPGAAYLRPPTATATDPSVARTVAETYRVWTRDQLLADRPLRPNTAGTDRFYETVRQDLDLGPD